MRYKDSSATKVTRPSTSAHLGSFSSDIELNRLNSYNRLYFLHYAFYISPSSSEGKMSSLGQVRIGHKAPYFEGDAVVQGTIKEVNINTYIRPTIQGEEPDPNAPWLILMFIPAAFSFVCPTEVLAFQNCLDEFKDRHCSVVFVSVDTKHSLWHWQNVPRQYGGLGNIDIPLLSDANHHIARDYGVLIEEEGVSLRGMFILDGEGIVQQVTLNNLTVGRSVLEALRLLEAFQAVAKHGVLCPVDWKPTGDAADTMNTISNTLTESYEERLANLQKEFGDTPITDLDAQDHREYDDNALTSSPRDTEDSLGAEDNLESSGTLTATTASTPLPDGTPPCTIQQVTCTRGMQRNQSPQHHTSSPVASTPSITPSSSARASSSSLAPPSATPPPLTPTTTTRSPSSRLSSPTASVSNLRGQATTATPTPSANRPSPRASQVNTSQMYETRGGSHIVLEFADPTHNPQKALTARKDGTPTDPMARKQQQGNSETLRTKSMPQTQAGLTAGAGAGAGAHAHRPESLDRARTRSEPPRPLSRSMLLSTPGAQQTRLQITLGAIKKMSAGIVSPRRDCAPRKAAAGAGTGGETSGPGYFDVTTDDGAEI